MSSEEWRVKKCPVKLSRMAIAVRQRHSIKYVNRQSPKRLLNLVMLMLRINANFGADVMVDSQAQELMCASWRLCLNSSESACNMRRKCVTTTYVLKVSHLVHRLSIRLVGVVVVVKVVVSTVIGVSSVSECRMCSSFAKWRVWSGHSHWIVLMMMMRRIK